MAKFYSYISFVGLQTLQAYIYDEFSLYKPIFIGCGAVNLLFSIILFIAMIIETHCSSNNNNNNNNTIDVRK